MKTLVLSFTLFVIPAIGQTLYSSGPTNGNWYAWTINFGFVVSDAFYVPSRGAAVVGAEFVMWLYPGDTLTSAELSITSGEFYGTTYFNQTLNFTQSACRSNNYGVNVCTETTSFNGPFLNSGTYWINLQNASVPSGDPVYWDQNIGPRPDTDSASENQLGTIPGETFTILGSSTTTSTCAGAGCVASQTVPEPDSIVLLCSGGMTLLGLLGALRRRLF